MAIKMDGRTRERFEIILEGTGSRLIKTDEKGRTTLSPVLIEEYERVADLRARGGVSNGSPSIDVLVLVIRLAEMQPPRPVAGKVESNGKRSRNKS